MSRENQSSGFPTRSDIIQAVQPQKIARGLKLQIYCTIRVAKTKALISFAVTAKLICVFVFAYAKGRFSYDATQMGVDKMGVGEMGSRQNGF